MTLFLSTFVNKIDKKGRVSVPSSFRATLSQESFQGFIAFRSYKHAAIECCGYHRMAQLSQSLDSFDVFSDTQDDIAAAIFADSLPIAFDGDGRIILPPELLAHSQITDQVAFVGRGSTFQIWNPQGFLDVQEAARNRMKTSGATLKLSQKGASHD